MPPLNARQIIRILKMNGFEKARQAGSHVIFRHSDTKRIVPIPIHNKNSPLPIGTFLAIIKQSGLPSGSFKK